MSTCGQSRLNADLAASFSFSPACLTEAEAWSSRPSASSSRSSARAADALLDLAAHLLGLVLHLVVERHVRTSRPVTALPRSAGARRRSMQGLTAGAGSIPGRTRIRVRPIRGCRVRRPRSVTRARTVWSAARPDPVGVTPATDLSYGQARTDEGVE